MNVFRLRVTLGLSAVICGVIWMVHETSIPSASACQYVQRLTGSVGAGCGSDPAMHAVGIAALVLAVLFALSVIVLNG
jgi:hypothetical protein